MRHVVRHGLQRYHTAPPHIRHRCPTPPAPSSCHTAGREASSLPAQLPYGPVPVAAPSPAVMNTCPHASAPHALLEAAAAAAHPHSLRHRARLCCRCCCCGPRWWRRARCAATCQWQHQANRLGLGLASRRVRGEKNNPSVSGNARPLSWDTMWRKAGSSQGAVERRGGTWKTAPPPAAVGRSRNPYWTGASTGEEVGTGLGAPLPAGP